MEEYTYTSDSRSASRFKVNRAGIIALLLVVNLLVSIVGGVFGFVLLSDTDAAWARTVRNALRIGDVSQVTIPTSRQSIRLEESSAIIDAAKKISPAVVSISASQLDEEISAGTGFILTADGLIVTNKHVVSQQATYKVILSDGRILDATVKAVDSFNDLAIVKVEAKDLPTVELGSSDDLQVGQTVLAIGNALGEFKNSVTSGIVSAKNRTIEAGSGSQTELLTELLQTDAAINPGNSGGPLVNVRGQVVGINTAIASQSISGGSIGVGFAIPIDSIRNVLDSVRKTGEIIRPYLGVRYRLVNKTVQQVYSLSVDYGALVGRGSTLGEPAVVAGGPADKAGIQEGDIILEINGERIDQDNPLTKRLTKYSVGQEVTLKVLRSGQTIEVKVTLDRAPAAS